MWLLETHGRTISCKKPHSDQNSYKSSTAVICMKIKILLEEQEEGGYTAYVPALQGCISQGETIEETLKNIKEAIELYLESDDNDLIINSDNVKTEIITI